MKFSFTLAAALFPAVLVNAVQYSSNSARPVTSTATPRVPSASPTPPSNPTNINVQVAPGGNLVYNPSNLTAKNGTIVTFYFPNSSILHSVTQGYFGKPCAYLAASGGNPAGFDSGLLSAKQYSLKITNDKEPIFFFCKAKGHCGLGMVGQVAINAPTTGNTYAAYLAGAKALGSSEPVISNTGAMTGGVGATPVPTQAVS